MTETPLPSLAKRRIVVVEDNFIVRSQIEAALERAGAIIVSLFDSAIDGAILDVALDDGVTSLPVARELDRRHIAFLFYTGQSDTYLQPIRDELPLSTIISKPAELGILLRTIGRLMADRRQRVAA